ncbi:hypothetical protein ACFL27_23120 [candidate division CSSED10-310 bacterium]|uniref:Flagellar assembly protein T N-terminal domain-containing protein n=1 Tax=candidate division CSSED10-310 bacterium TaxID=2855610 RepID=A0ABV6Z3S8_UNCC1
MVKHKLNFKHSLNSISQMCIIIPMILLFSGCASVVPSDRLDSAADVFSEQVTLTVEGVGETRDLALKDALRNAVEQGLGLILESKTEVKNSIVQSDHIITVSEDVVVKYEILDESGANAGLYKIEVKATVDRKKLKTNIQVLLHKHDNPKSMVIMDPDSTSNSKFSRIALRQIINYLTKQNFEVVNRDITEERPKKVRELMNVNNESLTYSELDPQYNADIAWMVTVKVKEGPTVYGLKQFKATIGCQVVYVCSGCMLADVAKSALGVDEEDAVRKSGEVIAEELVDIVKIKFASNTAELMVNLWDLKTHEDAAYFIKGVKKNKWVSGSQTKCTRS